MLGLFGSSDEGSEEKVKLGEDITRTVEETDNDADEADLEYFPTIEEAV